MVAVSASPSARVSWGCFFTQIVTLDLKIVGQDGRPVMDLKPADFSVVEDGKRQRLAVVLPRPSVSELKPPQASGPHRILGYRLTAFLFDSARTPNEETLNSIRVSPLVSRELVSLHPVSPDSFRARSEEIDFTDQPTTLPVPANAPIAPMDSREILNAIKGACLRFPAGFRKSIVYIRDSSAGDAPVDEADQKATLDACTGSGVALYPVGQPSSTLATLAVKTGGRISASVREAIGHIRNAPEADYLLSYYSTNIKFDGTYRHVELKLPRPGLSSATLEYQHGYLSEKEERAPKEIVEPACF